MRILVVEDERRMAELLRQGLTEDGHAVTVALDGRDGLAFAEAHGSAIAVSSTPGAGARFSLPLKS
jgi:DNA-binding response OmpR family regulator